MKKVLQTIGSLRITIVLVLVIVVFCIFGTLVNQQKVLDSVYRSPIFISLLILFGINLCACTLLRLKLRVARLGFLATHLGVLVILAGAIVGFLTSMKGRMNLADGEIANAYFETVRIDPRENLEKIQSAVKAHDGRFGEFDGMTVAAQMPVAHMRAALGSLKGSVEYAIEGMDKNNVRVKFYPGVHIVERPLPFALRLDSFKIEHYNHGDLLIADKESMDIIAKIPVATGASATVGEHKLEIGQYLPNFVIDTSTHVATTKNQKPDNPAVGVFVRNAAFAGEAEHQWVFAKHPGMSGHMRKGKPPLPFVLFFDYRERVKSYTSSVTVLDEAGREVKKTTIEVNRPLTHLGYTIYQSSYKYDPRGRLFTGLQVVRDLGVWVVYIGFALLIGGVIFIFYAKPYLRRSNTGKAV